MSKIDGPPATASEVGYRRVLASGVKQSGVKEIEAPPAKESREQEWQAELLDLGRAFRRVFRSLSRLRGRDTHLIGSEVSHAQMELLIELSERGPMSAGDLAAAAQLSPATVTQMLDHLAASGHVERTRSDADRRVVVTRLSVQGEDKVRAKRAIWQERWERILADVSAEDLHVTTRVLQLLNAVFEEVPSTSACKDEH
jgi:MarR family transcriptional regulator, organic hydroperoxide resistance regulator